MFKNCTSLTSITIPESVTSIEGDSFLGCTSLTNVTIPEGVTNIGGLAFCGCTSLISITIPESVTSIGEETFRECTSLIDVIIPEGVRNIEAYTFYMCSNLTSVTIPESVTNIANYAFDGCGKLKNVNFGGSKADWEKIVIGRQGNSTLLGASVHYHSCELVLIEAKEPTKTEDGNRAYYLCTICHKAYKDANGKQRTTVEAERLPKLREEITGTCGENVN